MNVELELNFKKSSTSRKENDHSFISFTLNKHGDESLSNESMFLILSSNLSHSVFQFNDPHPELGAS